jgi:hypothetical protein
MRYFPRLAGRNSMAPFGRSTGAWMIWKSPQASTVLMAELNTLVPTIDTLRENVLDASSTRQDLTGL